jgi:two-component system LytT family response regulator
MMIAFVRNSADNVPYSWELFHARGQAIFWVMKVTDHPQIDQGGFAHADGSLSPPEQPADDVAGARAVKGSKIRALVVDDELISRELLCRLLRSETDIELAGTASNGADAVEAIHRLEPDLVFLDVQMPELDGFGVVDQIQGVHMPVIIFVTANHEFALKAFEVHALDYLIKPCTRDRFREALQRARGQIQRDNTRELHHKLSTLLNQVQPGPKTLERIPVKSEGRIHFLRVADIDWLEAADNYVELHVGDRTHVLRETLSAMEAKLPVDRFLRINRSAMVNIEKIRELEPAFHGEYTVVLRDGTRLTLTRGHRQALQQLGLE